MILCILAVIGVATATMSDSSVARYRASKKSDADVLQMHHEGRAKVDAAKAMLVGAGVAAPNLAGIVSVLDYGAKGDNKTDNTAAFTDAIAALGTDGGIVYVPPGNYVFEGSLTIPEDVSMVGSYQAPSSHTMGQNGQFPSEGSVLQPRYGRGNATATPFLSLMSNAAVRGVVVWHDMQVCSPTPVPYPWTIDLVGVNSAVMDSELLNSYQAIRAVQAGRHYIARVQGQLLLSGIFIDETYDIGRVENVHFNPWWCNVATQFATEQGNFMTIGRSDWEYVFNTFIFGSATGYKFIKTETGSCNGNFVGIGADLASNASVLVEDSDLWGILIDNGEFTSFCTEKSFCNNATKAYDSTQIVILASNHGDVRISNSAFWGPSHAVIRSDGGTLGVTNSVFSQWDAAKTGRYAVEVGGGSAQLTNNDFQYDGNQISIGASVDRAVILGNLLAGTERIQVNSTSTIVEKGYNAAQKS